MNSNAYFVRLVWCDRHKKVACIRETREAFNLDLKTAKDFVEGKIPVLTIRMDPNLVELDRSLVVCARYVGIELEEAISKCATQAVESKEYDVATKLLAILTTPL